MIDRTVLRHLLALFSLRDLGPDSRDAILELAELCNAAQRAGVDPVPLLKEAALLSSDVNKHGLGSTKDILLRQATRFKTVPFDCHVGCADPSWVGSRPS